MAMLVTFAFMLIPIVATIVLGVADVLPSMDPLDPESGSTTARSARCSPAWSARCSACSRGRGDRARGPHGRAGGRRAAAHGRRGVAAQQGSAAPAPRADAGGRLRPDAGDRVADRGRRSGRGHGGHDSRRRARGAGRRARGGGSGLPLHPLPAAGGTGAGARGARRVRLPGPRGTALPARLLAASRHLPAGQPRRVADRPGDRDPVRDLRRRRRVRAARELGLRRHDAQQPRLDDPDRGASGPFTGGVLALQYLDQRFRKEGLDIELLEQTARPTNR